MGSDSALGGRRLHQHPYAVPTQDEMRHLLETAGEGRDGLVLRLLYSTGIRAGELVALRPEAIRSGDGTIFIAAGKGDKTRFVIADPATFARLQEFASAPLHKRTGPPGPRLTVFEVGESAIEVIVNKWAVRSGLSAKYRAQHLTVSPHSLRHAFATHCYENGMRLDVLKRLMGHTYLSTTDIYVQVGLERMRGEYRTAHPLGAHSARERTAQSHLPTWFGASEADFLYSTESAFRTDSTTTDEGDGSHKHPPAVPSQEEMETLLAAPDTLRDRLLLRLLYSTGLREAEVAHLRFCDLRKAAGVVLVRCGKDSKDRYACADDETFRLLDEWRTVAAEDGRAEPEDSVFGIKSTEIWRLVLISGKKTGLEQQYRKQRLSLSPQSFRHAFATHCYEKGIDLMALMHLLGHVTLSNTDRYVQVKPSICQSQYFDSHPASRRKGAP